MLMHLFSNEGIPANYRHMRGSSVHAFKWLNAYGNTVYVKYRWVPKQGILNLSAEEASEIQAKDFNHASRDLYDSIARGDFPEWDLFVQLLDPADIDNFDFDPLDPTKDWFEDVIPYQKVGTMTLNRNPDNVFAETESVGFNPGVVVPGIEPSEDKLLQGRLFSYSDTQRYRIGTNYLELPINCPYAQVNNNQRDGAMQFKQQKQHINYEPNRHEETPKQDPSFAETISPLNGSAGRQKIEKTNDFGQAGQVWQRYSIEEKAHVVKNLTADLQNVDNKTVLRAICNFYIADAELGKGLSESLNVDITPYLKHMK
jgi:catalase